MGVQTTTYAIVRDEHLLQLILLSDVYDDTEIDAVATTLRDYMERRAHLRPFLLLIDLRRCVGMAAAHVIATIRLLLGHKDALLELVGATAVVMRLTRTMVPLRDMFTRLYTPPRPFCIFGEYEPAITFLRAASQ